MLYFFAEHVMLVIFLLAAKADDNVYMHGTCARPREYYHLGTGVEWRRVYKRIGVASIVKQRELAG